jgi:DNA transformation protein
MSEFVDYLTEVFEAFGAIRSRRMFGGYGIYYADRMFGLVAADVLYLKADAQSVPLFEARGLAPFEYVKDGKAMKMSYYQAPEEIFDDPDVAREWAELAYAASLRSGQSGRKRAGRGRPPRK